MPRKSPDQAEQDAERAFSTAAGALRKFADLLDDYTKADGAEQQQIAGQLHLTAPTTVDAVKTISKYVEATHGQPAAE
ncbi:MAG: hypothetical protein OXG35_17690 [Acidobacteria bacterium]|nr:hypothetical protein [Acidobacteriota bacterium]